MRILVVDDDRLNRRYMVNFLKAYGTCDEVGDGLAAVGAYRSALEEGEPYGLLCLDIMMPHMDGMEVLRSVQDVYAEIGEEMAGPRPKVIMMTAIEDAQHINAAFELGCDAYASKPIDMAKVKEVMHALGIGPLSPVKAR